MLSCLFAGFTPPTPPAFQLSPPRSKTRKPAWQRLAEKAAAFWSNMFCLPDIVHVYQWRNSWNQSKAAGCLADTLQVAAVVLPSRWPSNFGWSLFQQKSIGICPVSFFPEPVSNSTFSWKIDFTPPSFLFCCRASQFSRQLHSRGVWKPFWNICGWCLQSYRLWATTKWLKVLKHHPTLSLFVGFMSFPSMLDDFTSIFWGDSMGYQRVEASFWPGNEILVLNLMISSVSCQVVGHKLQRSAPIFWSHWFSWFQLNRRFCTSQVGSVCSKASVEDLDGKNKQEIMQIFIKTLTGRKTNFNFELDLGIHGKKLEK